jgi:enamine deaminase RidA (YjgF/YER057c/UK114 family)
MLTTTKINEYTRFSAFTSPDGCDEFFIAVDTQPGTPFIQALRELTESHSLALKRAGLSENTVVFSRLFVSDIVNQQKALSASPIFSQLMKSALSVIEQKPVNGAPMSLLSYHVRCGGTGLQRETAHHSPDGWQNSALLKGKKYSLLFTANFSDTTAIDTSRQTKAVFESLDTVVYRNAMHLADDTIRTWVFVRNIDENYDDMVRARKDFFTAHGLTDKTRYLASTGIQGSTASVRQTVSIDSLSMGGLRPEQIVRMEAPAYLSPTIQYGVTFERGLRVRFGDRSHLYISGTASIGRKGDVLFTGDAARQTERTIENIRALLAGHNAAIKDMAYIIVYVRKGKDRETVRGVLDREIGPDIPLVFAEAAVCRPTWLVELEGLAVIPDKTEFPPFA